MTIEEYEKALEGVPKEHWDSRIFCPKCGKKASYWFKGTVKRKTKEGVTVHDYIYLVHYSTNDGKPHRWVFDKYSEEAVEHLKMLKIPGFSKRIVLGEEELGEIRDFLEGRGGEEVVMSLLKKMVDATKVVIKIHP